MVSEEALRVLSSDEMKLWWCGSGGESRWVRRVLFWWHRCSHVSSSQLPWRVTRPTSHGLLMFGPTARLMGQFVAFWLLGLWPFDYVVGPWAVYSGLGPFYQLKKKPIDGKKKRHWTQAFDFSLRAWASMISHADSQQ